MNNKQKIRYLNIQTKTKIQRKGNSKKFLVMSQSIEVEKKLIKVAVLII